MSEDSFSVITVEIHGQQYPIRSRLDATYVARLASYVDDKMQVAAGELDTGDSLKVAVLAALNIADECFRCRDTDHSAQADLLRRTAEIEALVDRTLAEFP